MKTLVIYDNEGFIISQMSGDVREPVGIPFLWVEIPEGKILIRIDITTNPHLPVFEDKTPTYQQQIEEQLANIKTRLSTNEELNLAVLEAMAETYEAVLPFLP